jgi:hypothetical protein
VAAWSEYLRRSSQPAMARRTDRPRLRHPLRLRCRLPRRRRRGPDDRLAPHGPTSAADRPRLERRAPLWPLAHRRLPQPVTPPSLSLPAAPKTGATWNNERGPTANLSAILTLLPAVNRWANLSEHAWVNLSDRQRHGKVPGRNRCVCPSRKRRLWYNDDMSIAFLPPRTWNEM